MKVTLRPLTAREFEARNAALITGYAESLRSSGRTAPDQALTQSRRQNAELLPNGVDTEGMLLLAAEDAGQQVGWVWVGLPEVTGHGMAWIYYLCIDAVHRGSGYGRAVIEAVEQLLAQRGVTRIGLNVFADNPVAIRLYEKLGFTVVAQQMAKSMVAPGLVLQP